MHIISTARRVLVAALGIVLVGLIGFAPSAHAEDPAATSYVFDGRISREGVLEVTATLTYDEAPEKVTQRLALKNQIDPQRAYIYTIDNVSASVGGQAIDVDTEESGDYLVITMDTSQAGSEPIELSYTVDGTTYTQSAGESELTVFSWRVLQGLSTGVQQVEGSIRVPMIPSLVDCLAGPPGAVTKCDLYSAGTQQNPQPAFESSNRGAGEQVTMVVGVPAETIAASAEIEELWSLDRAFRITPLTAAVALGTLLLGLGLLYLLHRRTGVDHAHDGDGTLVATFRPVAEGRSIFEVRDGVRPGEVGTVADERVDPVDVTGTMLDLAVRGHLHITELPRSQHEMLDWELTNTEKDQGELLEYERLFLEAIAPVGGSTRVSQLASTLAPALPGIQSALYDEVVNRGWFEDRPDSTRNSWRTRAIIAIALAVVAAVALVAFTNFGMLALVLLLLSVVFLRTAQEMPRRTVEGSKLMTGMHALSSLLKTQPTDRMPVGREIPEISKLLPYAVVLGGTQRWLQAMVAADDDDQAPDPYTIDWYHAPETWHLQDLPMSLNQFITTVQGLLFSR